MKSKIVSWIRQQVKDSGSKGVVLGLSGGIDSCVVAALAKEAVGKDKVLGLFMPCHSQPQDLVDARIIVRQLGIKTKLVDLTRAYDTLLKILPSAGTLPKANLRPRLRMLALYYFANKFNYMVSGTGNKSELMAGYFTKYGDGGVDILPIASLLKRDVRKLAKELNIPQHIILKPPTAGLWPGQTDEGEMGITYNNLDDILQRFADKKKQVLPQKTVNKVKMMMQRSEHKRQGPKICHL
ncbi:MAG: NAD+ synthase [Candidatus Omnitrophica bacterium]|nr:NAD+ synthase [Candidatus Omnitrophota bacterium]